MARLFAFVEQPGEGAAVVMQLVDGVSLREMLTRRGPLSALAALVVLKDSLLGLAAAHSRRVAHRDLKPDNVLIDTRGWCTLTDFGVAIKTDKQVPVAGTPAYMAPELWNGAPNVPATDTYAATAVFCESLTGKPLFSGRPGQLRQQHESEPVALDQFEPPLRDLIARGLAKNPADRPPSTLLAGGGVGSATATRLARRKMTIFISSVAVALVALVAVGAVALARSSGNAQLSSSSAAAFSAQVTVTPPVAAAKCTTTTTATTFTYGGTVTATQPGTLSYQWQYSSGKQGPVQTVNANAYTHANTDDHQSDGDRERYRDEHTMTHADNTDGPVLPLDAFPERFMAEDISPYAGETCPGSPARHRGQRQRSGAARAGGDGPPRRYCPERARHYPASQRSQFDLIDKADTNLTVY